MAEPVVTTFTRRWYERLPAFMRDADVDQDWALLRFLSLLGDQAGEVEALFDRIAYVAPDDYRPGMVANPAWDTSELVDPALADAGWLPWLAQLVGVKLLPLMAEADRRSAIADASSGWRVGTKVAVKAAVRTRLSGSQYVELHTHSTSAGVGTGGAFDVLIVTKDSETLGWHALEANAPTWADVEALGSWEAVELLANAKLAETIAAAGAKPAGVKFWWAPFRASWGAIEAEFPTWTDIEAAGSWAAIQEAGA